MRSETCDIYSVRWNDAEKAQKRGTHLLRLTFNCADLARLQLERGRTSQKWCKRRIDAVNIRRSASLESLTQSL